MRSTCAWSRGRSGASRPPGVSARSRPAPARSISRSNTSSRAAYSRGCWSPCSTALPIRWWTPLRAAPTRSMAALRVEVVYALPGGEDAVSVEVAPGSTLRDAIQASGLIARHPEIDLERQKIGVYGKVKAADAPAAQGDRIEIYRALPVEPKEARRRRAARKS